MVPLASPGRSIKAEVRAASSQRVDATGARHSVLQESEECAAWAIAAQIPACAQQNNNLSHPIVTSKACQLNSWKSAGPYFEALYYLI
ncbi:hypothetical protein E2C01_014980 [Portunus trituberculatus]|uniref:Uncharacterized protein n=1 Tax=Portunus trituberculatus TaxID=210409 RepID=A0A5B7DLX4_PORTR|nr:hypothetical protein [Portunus trituberculatus]